MIQEDGVLKRPPTCQMRNANHGTTAHPFAIRGLADNHQPEIRGHLSPKRGVALPPFLERGQPGPPRRARPCPSSRPQTAKPSPETPGIRTTKEKPQAPDKHEALTPTRDGSRYLVRSPPAAFIKRLQFGALVCITQPNSNTNPSQDTIALHTPNPLVGTRRRRCKPRQNRQPSLAKSQQSKRPAQPKSLSVCIALPTGTSFCFLSSLPHQFRRMAQTGVKEGRFRADKRHPQKPRCHLLTSTIFQARAEGKGGEVLASRRT